MHVPYLLRAIEASSACLHVALCNAECHPCKLHGRTTVLREVRAQAACVSACRSSQGGLRELRVQGRHRLEAVSTGLRQVAARRKFMRALQLWLVRAGTRRL